MRKLEQLKKNLERLEEQAALYGMAQPLWLINEIEYHKTRIKELEHEEEQIRADLDINRSTSINEKIFQKIKHHKTKVILTIILFTSLLGVIFVSSSPKTVFSDDFKDPLVTTARWTKVKGSWKNVEGSYYSSVNGAYEFALSTVGESAWKDYTYSVDIKGDKGIDKMIVFRYQDDINTYVANLRSAPFNDVILVKGLLNGQILQTAKLGNSNDVWYQLKVVAVGNSLQVYVNDQLYIKYLDEFSPFLNGRVGVTIFTGATNETATYFDNVEVTTVSWWR